MNEDLIVGLEPKDFYELLEMLCLLGQAVFVIFVLIVPLKHFLFTSFVNPSATIPRYIPAPASPQEKLKAEVVHLWENYLVSLRATLPRSLLILVLIIGAMAIGIWGDF